MFAALGLGNVALETITHQRLLRRAVVDALMHASDAPDPQTRRCVAFCFNNLAANVDNHAAAHRIGLLPALVKLGMVLEDETCCLQAITALRRLAVYPENNELIVQRYAGIDPLLACCTIKFLSIELQRGIAAAFRNFSLNDDNKVEIVKSGALFNLVAFTANPEEDLELTHQATGVLANLAEHPTNQPRMVAEGVVQQFKHLIMQHESPLVVREATRGMANLAAEFSSTTEMASGGAFVPMLQILKRSQDTMTQRYAAMGLGNLCSNPSNQISMVHEEGALDELLKLARFSNGDLDSQRYAVICVSNACQSRGAHEKLIESGTVRVMQAKTNTWHAPV